MKRFIYWLNFKKRKTFRSCNACCLNCTYFQVCRCDGVEIWEVKNAKCIQLCIFKTVLPWKSFANHSVSIAWENQIPYGKNYKGGVLLAKWILFRHGYCYRVFYSCNLLHLLRLYFFNGGHKRCRRLKLKKLLRKLRRLSIWLLMNWKTRSLKLWKKSRKTKM